MSQTTLLQRPNIPTSIHPVLRVHYILETPEITRLVVEVERWVVEDHEPGAIICGRPRLGKTQARQAIAAFLKDRLGDSVIVYEIDIEGRNHPSRSAFYELLLEGVGHEDPGSGSAENKRRRLIASLQNEIRRLKARVNPDITPTVVFCFDEAHLLLEDNYQTLIHVYNLLQNEDAFLSFLLFGQPQLAMRRNAFREQGLQQIIARFMCREYQFFGVRSPDEMAAVLTEYDISEYPEGSGWSFTRFFFPEAVGQGCRLEEFGDGLFAEFVRARSQQGVRDTEVFDIPMQYVARAIEYLFRTYGYEGVRPLDWLNQNLLAEAVERSGFAAAELGINGSQKRKD